MSAMETAKRGTAARPEKNSRREIANFNERRRMKSINDGFESLKELLPADRDKFSKAAILQHANDYIKFLIQRNKELTEEVTQLRTGPMIPTMPMMSIAYPMQSQSHQGPATMSRASSPEASPVPAPANKVLTKRRRPTSTKKARSNASKSRPKPSQSKLDVMLAAIDTLERAGDSDARSVDSADSNSDSEHGYGYYRNTSFVTTPTAMTWNVNQDANQQMASHRLQLD